MLGCAGGGEEASVQAIAALFPTTNLLTVRDQTEAAGLPRPAFLAALAGLPLPDLAAGLLGLQDVTDDLPAAREASALTHAAHMTGPTLLSHGDRDGLVNLEQSVAMHEALLAAGHESQLIILAGANHEDEQFQSGAVLAAHAGFFRALL
jgi:acetyl esterase/lipase